MTKLITTNYTLGVVALLVTSVLFALMSLPAFADAATYAYVDSAGEVKSVTAGDWRTAIEIAPNRHLNSGVLLLSSASDFGIVGDNVPAF